jgi:hypothetical protein
MAQGFHSVTMIALKKKATATKCSDHHIISLIAHTAKIVAKILSKRIGRKTEDVLGEDQFGFRKGKGTRHATGCWEYNSKLWSQIRNCAHVSKTGRRHLAM